MANYRKNYTPKKSKYTHSQKKAYYSGMGYRAAREGKQIPFRNAENKESFRAGFNAALETVRKYPDLKR